VFIQIVQGSCTRREELHSVVDEWCVDMADRPGWLGGTFGFTGNGSFVGVVRFETSAAAHENARRPESAMWWAAAAALFDSPPRCHESDDVLMMMAGGSDNAGFVQVIQGRIKDSALLRTMTGDSRLISMLHEARPDIIGATLVIEEDGSFTETIAFTSENAAREGERADLPAEVANALDGSMEDVTYTDLHEPWFGSHD
jgi:hypothetical protein